MLLEGRIECRSKGKMCVYRIMNIRACIQRRSVAKDPKSNLFLDAIIVNRAGLFEEPMTRIP